MKRLLLALALAAGVAPAWAQQSVTITNLPQLTAPADGDLFVLEHVAGAPGARTSSLSASALASYVFARSGTAAGLQTLTSSIGAEIARAQGAEQANATAISAEVTRAKAAEVQNASAIAANASAIAAEMGRAQGAEALLAPLASPTLTGVPSAPTAVAGTSTAQLATTAFDTAAVAAEAAIARNAANLSSGTVPAARLPVPSATTLGGVVAAAAPANSFGTGVGANGVPTFAQPAFSNLSGSLAGSQMPALSGDVVTAAGSLATTIQPGAVSNAKMANAPALTIKANTSGSAAAPSDVTPSTLLDAAFGSAQGGLLYRGPSAWTLLGPGSSGQVLGTGGAGATPSWVTPAGGTSGTQSANTALMGPASGAAAAPSYRALVAADAPFAAPIAAYDGRCFLALSGSSGTSAATLVLSPLAGNAVFVNGALVTIPDAGISLAPPSGNTGALYWIYLTSAGALEASATAPVVQAGTGLRIKGGASGATDPTRRLVGMAQTSSAGYWTDSAQYRYVRSYFNDPGIGASATLASNVSQTSSSNGVLADGVIVLLWAGEIANLSAQAGMSSGAANGGANVKVAVNGTVVSGSVGGQSYGAGAQFSATATASYKVPSDGQYAISTYVASDGTNQGTWYAGATTSLTTGGNGVR